MVKGFNISHLNKILHKIPLPTISYYHHKMLVSRTFPFSTKYLCIPLKQLHLSSSLLLQSIQSHMWGKKKGYPAFVRKIVLVVLWSLSFERTNLKTGYARTSGALNESFSSKWGRKETLGVSCYNDAVCERTTARKTWLYSFPCPTHNGTTHSKTKEHHSCLCSPFSSMPLQQTTDLQWIRCVFKRQGRGTNIKDLCICCSSQA